MNKTDNSLISRPEFLEASAEELRVLVAVRELGYTPDADSLAEICKISRARARSAISFWLDLGAIGESGTKVTEEFEERLRRGELMEEPSVKVARDIRDEKLKELFEEFSALMKKSALTTAEIKKLSALYTQYSLSREYILNLAAHLAGRGKLTVPRLVDEALKLVGRDIDSTDKLIDYINEKENESAIEQELRRLLGIYNRAITKREKAYFKRWSEEFGYFTEIIGEAFDITVENTQKRSFAYMDKILTAWHEGGCRTLAECRAMDETTKKTRSEKEAKKKDSAQKKPKAEKPRYGDFDINEAFEKALQRSYGTTETKK